VAGSCLAHDLLAVVDGPHADPLADQPEHAVEDNAAHVVPHNDFSRF
jgi:hypothetical protein